MNGGREAGGHGFRTANPSLRREHWSTRVVRVLNSGNLGNPDVLLVDLGERLAVVKDFSPRPLWVRETLGRWLTGREIRAYRALSGHPAVPRYLGRVDALAFAVEYRPGHRMAGRLRGAVPPTFVPELEAAVRAMHERGVVHLDLSHRSNVLVDGEGHPVLIDFASALCFPRDGWLARIALGAVARVDLRALRKWRQKFAPSGGDGLGGASSGRRGASRPT